ncbi:MULTISPECIES: hypothetical protein [Rhodomicrobium]|uniref:hypothetical protein n=1 Tax=Rhodomicrobium TaxID=1068 RepID=UPI00247826C8|nr:MULTISPECIES: hypothetical protein [Rhodomicrobium]
MEADQIDQFTRPWAQEINASGTTYVTPAMARGRWMVRVSIGAPGTSAADVEALWACIRATTAKMMTIL